MTQNEDYTTQEVKFSEPTFFLQDETLGTSSNQFHN